MWSCESRGSEAAVKIVSSVIQTPGHWGSNNFIIGTSWGSGLGCELVLKRHACVASDAIPLLIAAYMCLSLLRCVCVAPCLCVTRCAHLNDLLYENITLLPCIVCQCQEAVPPTLLLNTDDKKCLLHKSWWMTDRSRTAKGGSHTSGSMSHDGSTFRLYKYIWLMCVIN